MKKAIVGFAAVATVVGLLVAVRRMAREMHEHSQQMKAHCKQMAAHCKEMMASRNGSDDVPSECEVEERSEERSKKERAMAPTA